MERHVKERLIGAAVLVAAAVILIPEMLSGPDREAEREPAVAVAGNVPLKTYTIDLNRSPSAPLPAADQVSEQAPPPELSGSTSEPSASSPEPDQVNPESSSPAQTPADSVPQASTQTPYPEAAGSSEPPAPTVTPKPKPVAAAPAKVPAADVVSATTQSGSPASSGWVVQLGSFSSQATAARLARQFRGEGYDAFVMPVKSGGNTLYRVRLGPPAADREAAARVLKRVKGRVPGAAVVRHP